MAHSFQLELVSPERLVVSRAAVMVVVPGGMGRYGVLAAHAPMITTLDPGVVEIYENNETTITDRIFVAGGFAEVTETRCTLLAEEAIPVSQLDRAALESEAKRLVADMKAKENEPSLLEALAAKFA
ncbi:MAG: ATP synthase F1 subunit epsilon, partial [Alphaproteobacteria bacterium]|nr:ATP synthase F1 subunit epsilon [Alphaproteobacteria bacterium]